MPCPHYTCLGHGLRQLCSFFRTRHAVSLRVIGYSCRDAACSVRIVVRVGVFVFFVIVFPFFGCRPSVQFSVCLIHPLRFARPACLRGTVCWRGGGGCLFIIGRCTQRPYNLKRIEREFSIYKVGFPFSVCRLSLLVARYNQNNFFLLSLPTSVHTYKKRPAGEAGRLIWNKV